MHSVNAALGDLVRELYRQQQVNVVSTYNPAASLSGDFGISAQLHSGIVVDFWIELDCTEASWPIDYSVLRKDLEDDDARDVITFPSQVVESVLDLPKVLVVAVENLRAASSDESLYK